jgi:hypothetical protein
MAALSICSAGPEMDVRIRRQVAALGGVIQHIRPYGIASSSSSLCLTTNYISCLTGAQWWWGRRPGCLSPLNLHSRRPILAGMPRKSKQPTPTSWNIYQVAEKAVWLGTVEAPDKQAAIEKGAQEFKTEAWRLYAVARR